MVRRFSLWLLFLIALSVPADALTSGQIAAIFSGGTFDPATIAWAKAVTTAGGSISNAQEQRVNSLITTLKADGLFSTCDRIWLHASENTQQATIDIINLDTLVNGVAPTFTVNKGFVGNGTTQYLKSSFTTGTNFTQNSAAVGSYVVNSRTSTNSGEPFGSASASYLTVLAPLAGGNVTDWSVNEASFHSNGASNAQGFWALSRTGSTAEALYKNGSSTALQSQTTTSVTPTQPFYILARNTSGTASLFSSDTVGVTYFCGGFTGAKIAQLNNAINVYMKAIGANVY